MVTAGMACEPREEQCVYYLAMDVKGQPARARQHHKPTKEDEHA